MSVEIDCYRLRAKQEDILEESFSIEPGGVSFISFSKDALVMTHCDKENKRGSILIGGRNPRARLTLKLFTGEEDHQGRWITFKTNKPFWIEENQELSILYKKYIGKDYYTRGVYIYLDSDDNNDFEEIPITPEGELQPIIS